MYFEQEGIAGKRRKNDTDDFTVTGLLSMTRAVEKKVKRGKLCWCLFLDNTVRKALCHASLHPHQGSSGHQQPRLTIRRLRLINLQQGRRQSHNH